MLENDIAAVYERMAQAEAPPPQISIPAATRRGQARRRARRLTVIATPVLAAAAVAGIAVASLVPAASPGSALLPPATGTAFSVAQPELDMQTLPAGTGREVAFLAPGYQLYVPHQGQELELLAQGQCSLVAGRLTCPKNPYASVLPRTFPLRHTAGLVHGHRSYWVPRTYPYASGETGCRVTVPGKPRTTNTKDSGIASSHVTQTRCRKQWSAYDGTLAWQFAPGSWALLEARTPAIALALARPLKFGDHANPPTRFPAVLAGQPSSVRVGVVNLEPNRSRLGSAAIFTGSTPVLSWAIYRHPRTASCTDVPAPPYHGVTTAMVNSTRVVIFHIHSVPLQWTVCAPDMSGVTIWLTGSDKAALLRQFADVQSLGTNPAGWASYPVRP